MNATISYRSRACFRLGVGAVIVGTAMQLPMFFDARGMHYQLRGMPITVTMSLGMALMIVGVVVATYGLLAPAGERRVGLLVHTIEEASLGMRHVGLILVLGLAVMIDALKPMTLAFVAPGAALEYGLKSPLHPHAAGWPIALYPLSGIAGTVVGSLVWGWLGDRCGRRASILIAALLFIATSTCGAMPRYWMNLVMCFVMGLGVGGMLPIVFALISETVPARHRSWVIVLIGGSAIGAYIIVSWLASTIGAPSAFGWRALWLIGIPVSVILVLLNRWIPESPRYLVERGRYEEAQATLAKYGAKLEFATQPLDPATSAIEDRVSSRSLMRVPFLNITVALVILGVGIGMVQFGFQQWIPSNLQHMGLSQVSASRTLRDSAVLGAPLVIPIAAAYGFWSSRRTLTLLAAIIAIALLCFAGLAGSVSSHPLILRLLLVLPIWGANSLTVLTIAYASEIYPTRIRTTGSGAIAGATKFGGVMVLAGAATSISAPSIAATALLGAVPLLVGVALVSYCRIETSRTRLEEVIPSAISNARLAFSAAIED